MKSREPGETGGSGSGGSARTLGLCAGLLPVLARGAEAGAPVSSSQQLAQVFMGLCVVVLLIFGLSVLLRRLKVLPGSSGVIRVIGGISLGAKERLILVQVGEEQILLSASPGSVNKIHKLEKTVEAPGPRAAGDGEARGFGDILAGLLNGRRP